jgi:RNA polymerase sigma factor (TIGR02999 family)
MPRTDAAGGDSGGGTGGEVTRLLERVGRGERSASEELLPLLYDELRKLARARLARERPGVTLQPTALVHEAYLRLVGDGGATWEHRGHFFAAAAEAMRRILIERARRSARVRHGGELRRATLSDQIPAGGAEGPDAEEMLAIDEALARLEQRDERMAQVVKLRYFADLTVEETAEATGLSVRTVTRLWTAARAWLARELGAGRS